MDNTVLDWTSKHQPYVTLSSGDSETVAAASAATQAEYWSQLFEHSTTGWCVVQTPSWGLVAWRQGGANPYWGHDVEGHDVEGD